MANNDRRIRHGFRGASIDPRGGGGSSLDSFVVVGLAPDLTNSRQIAGEVNVVELTDNGPGSTLVVGVVTNGIDFTKIRQIPTNTILGRSTAGTGNVETITIGSGLILSSGVLQASGGAGSGDVVGPNSSTDNAIARFDGTTGKIIQNSAVGVDDSGNISTSGTVNGRNVAADGSAIDLYLPSASEKDALEGTNGTPSITNKYVTDSDPRLSGGSSVNKGTATINFGIGNGINNRSSSSVDVIGQIWVAADSIINAWIRPDATTDHTVDEVMWEEIQCYVGNIVIGTGFTIFAYVPKGRTYGDFKVNWSGN